MQTGQGRIIQRTKSRKKKLKLAKEAKRETGKEFGTRMEINNNGNQKLFYKVLISTSQIKKQARRNILTEGDKIINRCKQYFYKLFNLGGGTNHTGNRET